MSSVHITGLAADSGQVVTLNLTLGTKGCKGEMGIKGEGTFSLLKIGKTLWIKPDNQFWKYAAGSSLTPAVIQILAGKYIKPSAKDSSLSSLGAFCNPGQFAAAFGRPGQPAWSKDGTTTITGQPALRIKDNGDSGVVYVTVSARPEFLRLDGGSSGQLELQRLQQRPCGSPRRRRARPSTAPSTASDHRARTRLEKLAAPPRPPWSGSRRPSTGQRGNSRPLTGRESAPRRPRWVDLKV